MTPNLPLEFWGGWVVVLTLVSLAGFAVFIYGIYFGSAPKEEETETVWDENLQEGEHPAPMWWFWVMLAALCFSLIYLILYPGLGSYAGAFGWTQGGELSERLLRYEDEFGGRRQEIASLSIDELQSESDLMVIAERVYARHCSACHGADGQGQANTFPNIRDSSWQWGSEPADIEKSIREGRQAVMVGWSHSLNRRETSHLAQYVVSLAGEGTPNPIGKAKFEQLCASCHKADGTGEPLLGAPDLTAGTFTYGGDILSIKHTVLYGRQGEMPGFNDHLDDMQIKLLVAWLLR